MRIICPPICSCSETNPEGRGERDIVCSSVLTRLRWDFEDKRTESRLECRRFKPSIASLSNFLSTGFVVHFVVDRIRTVSDRKQCSNLLFLLFMSDILDVIRLSMTRQNLFMNTRKLSWKSAEEIALPGHLPRLIVRSTRIKTC